MADRIEALPMSGTRAPEARELRWPLALLTAIGAAAVGVGCSDSGSCGGPGAIDGVYVSTELAMTMDVLECDGEVTGTLASAGREYQLTGARVDDEFSWSATLADQCATYSSSRTISSNSLNEFVVDADGDSFTGSLRIFEAPCGASRTIVRGETTTFSR